MKPNKLFFLIVILSVITNTIFAGNGKSSATSKNNSVETNIRVKTSLKEPEKIILGKNDPDFASMTTSQWATYEFNMDYANLFTDITSYDHKFLREMLDLHWTTYLGCTLPTSKLTDAERRSALTKLHNTRMKAVPVSNPESKRIYLWPKGKVPCVTNYTENKGYAYADNPGFEPFMLECLVDKDTKIKGAVIIATGGGHNFRSNVEEGIEVALALNALGYQCFIVNYRIKPYTDQESALDMARAVKIVRLNAEKYGVDKDKIATSGFSYGGIVTSLAADIYSGTINASALVKSYVPDQIDAVSADMNAYLAVYSVTPDTITNKNFPPTFFAFGGDDRIWDWVMRCFKNCLDLKVKVEMHTFAGVPHGIGAGTGADGKVYPNASIWPSLADSFMDDVYAKAAQAK